MPVKKTSKERDLLTIFCFIFILLASSCSSAKKSSTPPEDELFLTRKYIGNFSDYKHTSPERFGNPHIVWIKTNQDTTYGKLSVYSKECAFEKGDRLYLRRTHVSPGIWGYWEYQLENEKFIFYKVSEFESDKKVLFQSWF